MLKQSLSILKQLGSVGKSQDATDLLHGDLVTVEQRVEPAKKAAQVIHKKLQGCLQSQQGVEAEKRMKKLPLMLLSVSMAESLKDFDAESPIRRVLEMCCFMEKMLANMLADFEMKLEKEVMEPLNKLSEEDLPEVLKNKKLFAKLTMDWHNAQNKCQASTGPQAKQDGLREEVEEAWRKLENIRDLYSADLYHFATKEDNYANYFIRLLELQADYHKSSNEFLYHYITEIKENNSPKESHVSLFKKKVYGEPLLSHLTESNREIAAPIQECVHMLLKTGMKEEGLFRLAAGASVMKRLKTCLDRGVVDHSEFSTDPHAVAGALKCYLRELPEPLMTSELYSDWFKAAGVKELEDKLEHLRCLLKTLPPENYNNLRYLVQFLSLLSEQQAINRMTPSNIAIVLGPNLLWPHSEGKETTLDMASASSVQVVTVIEPLIQYSSSLFPEEVHFEIPLLPESPVFSPSIPDVQSLASEKEKLTTKTSSSSTSFTYSSYQAPLPKTTSPQSQYGGGFFLMKSGSVNRSGTTTWQNLTSDPAGTPHPNQLTSSLSLPWVPSTTLNSTTSQSPTPVPRTTPAPKPVQFKQSSDAGQLDSILEASPGSPTATLHISSPYKQKRSYNLNKGPPGQLVFQYTKSPAPTPPRPQVSAPPTAGQATPDPKPQPDSSSRANLPIAKKPNIKKLQAPKCPPPLPPPVEAKRIPSVAQ